MESELNSFQTRIFDIRGRKVMIDIHLAEAYGVTTKRLREQVRRNPERFPIDFMFILDKEEVTEVAAKCGDLPNLKYFAGIVYAFTEHGTVMLASV